jgi:hypothetical protein
MHCTHYRCAWNDCHTLEVARTRLGLGRGSVHVPMGHSTGGGLSSSTPESMFSSFNGKDAGKGAFAGGKDSEKVRIDYVEHYTLYYTLHHTVQYTYHTLYSL